MGHRIALPFVCAGVVTALLGLGAPALASPAGNDSSTAVAGSVDLAVALVSPASATAAKGDDTSEFRVALEPSRRVLLDLDFSAGETGMFEVHFGAHGAMGVKIALEQQGGRDTTLLHLAAGLTWIENRMGTFDASSSYFGFTVGTMVGVTLEKVL